MGVTRWGIISTGLISQDFVSGLKSQPDYHEVVAVCARKLESAQKFAAKYEIPEAYEGLQALAENPHIDVVYIAPIHPFHYEYSMTMLRAGKNVLCEKPMTMNLRQAKDVIDLAKEKNLFFMEGFWSRTFPIYHYIRKQIKEKAIGDVKYVQAAFCQERIHIDRVKDLSIGGGALLDLGCYVIQFALMVFGEMPHKIVATGNKGPTGVDDTTVIVLYFSDNRMANLFTSCSMPNKNEAIIVGTKGNLEIPQYFWAPTQINTPSGLQEFPLPSCKYQLNFPNSQGLQYEANCVHECLQKGAKEYEYLTHEDSLNIMGVMDEVRKQIGISYPADKE